MSGNSFMERGKLRSRGASGRPFLGTDTLILSAQSLFAVDIPTYLDNGLP